MRHIISFLLIFTALAANGRQVTAEEAQAIAYEFLNSGSTSAKKAPSRVVRASVADQSIPAGVQPYYIFNAADGAGFVIISGDTRTKKILGYSDRGSFNINKMPPQLIWLLSEYSSQVAALPAQAPPNPTWSDSGRSEGDTHLLETAHWGQFYPFNIYAPEIDGVNCLSGCVATAMAIIMKYHGYPQKGRGRHSYISNGQTLDFDFSASSFDFSQMLDKYEEGAYTDSQAKAVANLMKAAGAAVNMQYGLTASSAIPCVIAHYFHEYFHYSPECQYITAKKFQSRRMVDDPEGPD